MHFKSLPEPKASTVKGIYDEKLAALEFDDIAEIFELIESSSRIHKALKPIFTSVIKVSTQDVLMNSLGVNVEDKATIFIAMLGILTTKGITPNFYMDFMSTRKYDFDPSDFGKQVGEEALACSGPKTINFKGKCNVILHPNAFFGFPKGLLDLVMHQVKASSLVERKSLFIDKVNEEIASQELTIIDDGSLENGLFTSSHDAEGFHDRKPL
jgi:PmbA protein